MSGDHEDLIDMLTRVADSIDERSLADLQQAVHDGLGKRPESDRHLLQARRAIDKAITALRRAGGGQVPERWDDP